MDEGYFSKIDSPSKAQILGFFAADGCLHVKKNEKEKVVTIALAAVDEPYLRWIANEWRTDRPLHYSVSGKGSKIACLRNSSGRMFDDLQRAGLTPRKSLTLKPPLETQVPAELIRDYIRGFFEGDGGICPWKLRMTLGFCGPYEFMIWIGEILKRELDIHTCILEDQRPRINFCHLKMSGPKSCLRFLEWIYRDAPYKMQRKWETYQMLRSRYDDNLQFIKTPEWISRTSENRKRGAAAMSHETRLRTNAAVRKAHEHKFLRFVITSPTGVVYDVESLKPFAARMGLPNSALRHLYMTGKAYKSVRGWKIATEDEAKALRDSGTLIRYPYLSAVTATPNEPATPPIAPIVPISTPVATTAAA